MMDERMRIKEKSTPERKERRKNIRRTREKRNDFLNVWQTSTKDYRLKLTRQTKHKNRIYKSFSFVRIFCNTYVLLVKLYGGLALGTQINKYQRTV